MGQILQRRSDGEWEYTSAATTQEEAGFETMEEYIWQRQNTAAQYISARSLLDLCEATEKTPGAWVWMRWWEQADIDSAGARKTATAEAEADEGRR